MVEQEDFDRFSLAVESASEFARLSSSDDLPLKIVRRKDDPVGMAVRGLGQYLSDRRLGVGIRLGCDGVGVDQPASTIDEKGAPCSSLLAKPAALEHVDDRVRATKLGALQPGAVRILGDSAIALNEMMESRIMGFLDPKGRMAGTRSWVEEAFNQVVQSG